MGLVNMIFGQTCSCAGVSNKVANKCDVVFNVLNLFFLASFVPDV